MRRTPLGTLVSAGIIAAVSAATLTAAPASFARPESPALVRGLPEATRAAGLSAESLRRVIGDDRLRVTDVELEVDAGASGVFYSLTVEAAPSGGDGPGADTGATYFVQLATFTDLDERAANLDPMLMAARSQPGSSYVDSRGVVSWRREGSYVAVLTSGRAYTVGSCPTRACAITIARAQLDSWAAQDFPRGEAALPRGTFIPSPTIRRKALLTAGETADQLGIARDAMTLNGRGRVYGIPRTVLVNFVSADPPVTVQVDIAQYGGRRLQRLVLFPPGLAALPAGITRVRSLQPSVFTTANRDADGRVIGVWAVVRAKGFVASAHCAWEGEPSSQLNRLRECATNLALAQRDKAQPLFGT